MLIVILIVFNHRAMNILLVYPQYPDSFWSFKHAMRFISKSFRSSIGIDHHCGNAAKSMAQKSGRHEYYHT